MPNRLSTTLFWSILSTLALSCGDSGSDDNADETSGDGDGDPGDGDGDPGDGDGDPGDGDGDGDGDTGDGDGDGDGDTGDGDGEIECTQDEDCDDNDVCTIGTCPAGTCEYEDISCDDRDNCTLDGCDANIGCLNDPVDESGMQIYENTGDVQQFIVPECITTSVHIVAFGAQGGTDEGGRGARMSGVFDLAPGEVLGVVVGAQGDFNECGSGGGGGGSFVYLADDMTEPLIAAGGGGGGNHVWDNLFCREGVDAVIEINGTQGRLMTSALGGMNGLGGSGSAPAGVGAGGAGWKGDGQDSTFQPPAFGGQSQPDFLGGAGGQTYAPGGVGGFGGGGGAVCGCGGGGGYSGGGGGEGQSCRAGGGGGGSYNSGMDQDNAPGVQMGDGEVVISWGNP